MDLDTESVPPDDEDGGKDEEKENVDNLNDNLKDSLCSA